MPPLQPCRGEITDMPHRHVTLSTGRQGYQGLSSLLQADKVIKACHPFYRQTRLSRPVTPSTGRQGYQVTDIPARPVTPSTGRQCYQVTDIPTRTVTHSTGRQGYHVTDIPARPVTPSTGRQCYQITDMPTRSVTPSTGRQGERCSTPENRAIVLPARLWHSYGPRLNCVIDSRMIIVIQFVS